MTELMIVIGTAVVVGPVCLVIGAAMAVGAQADATAERQVEQPRRGNGFLTIV